MEYGELMADILALILKRVVLRTAESHLPVLAVKTCTSISVLAKVKIGKNQKYLPLFDEHRISDS